MVDMGFVAEIRGQTASAAEQEQKIKVGDVNIVPLQVTGPADERLNLVIFGDGYTADEMDKFHKDVDRNQNVQWSVEPFRSYRNYFNVYMVETPSIDSGISCDPDDGNIRRDTVFKLEYASNCPADEFARGVTLGAGGAQALDAITADLAAELGIPANAQNIQTLVIGNTFTYGGIGGRYATTTGGSPQGPLVSLHELGHSLANLQDEYPYYDRGVPGAGQADREPNSIHHTRMTSKEMIENKAKWWRWLGEESESGGIIRAADPDGYEGGMYFGTNIWRPSEHSMMRATGFYFDQISREQMTQRITGMRNAGKMPVSSTTEGEVGPEDVLWIETMHPRFHMLDVIWEVNGNKIVDTNNSRHLELNNLDLTVGDIVKVTVKDKTDFVRNPDFLDGPRMTQTREWTVGNAETAPETELDIEFTNYSATVHALANNEVVFVQTPNPINRMLKVTWELNGEELTETNNRRLLDLEELNLPDGPSELSATVTDSLNPDGNSDRISWTIDNGLPTAPKTLSKPLASLTGETEHNVYFNNFDILLEPEDDQSGYIVGELRLNGRGWYNYFGFPDEQEGTPFTFSHSGTDVKELTYGNLGTGGLATVTFEQSYSSFIPGFGTHVIEHRAIDATGNIGEAEAFQATVLPGDPLACTETITGNYNGGLVIAAGVVCLENAKVNGGVTIDDRASLVATGSTINGGLQSNGAVAVHMFETTVNGKAQISFTTTDTTLVGNSLNGGLTLSDNTQVSVNKQYGEYGPILAGNHVKGSLSCIGNSSKVTDFGAGNIVKGLQTGECGDPSTANIIALVKHLDEKGEFTNASAVRALQMHLTAVERFEQQEAIEKVIKHLERFKVLLDQQVENGLITEEAFEVLKADTELLIEYWI